MSDSYDIFEGTQYESFAMADDDSSDDELIVLSGETYDGVPVEFFEGDDDEDILAPSRDSRSYDVLESDDWEDSDDGY